MKHPISYIKQVSTIAIILLFVCALEAAGLFLFFIQVESTKVAKQTCGSFSTYQEALRAYNTGNTALDHNGNGVPCETLL